jgi:hypothetical protein
MNHEVLKDPLAPGEEILWTGRPYGGFYLDPRCIFPAMFGVFFLIFALLAMARILADPKPMPMDGFVFLTFWFVGVGSVSIYFVFGRFWLDARRRQRIHYTLTNQRVIICSGLIVPKKTVVDLASINNLSWESALHGRGHVLFAPRSEAIAAWFHPGFNPWYLGLGVPAFELVDEPERLFELVRTGRTQLLGRTEPAS